MESRKYRKAKNKAQQSHLQLQGYAAYMQMWNVLSWDCAVFISTQISLGFFS